MSAVINPASLWKPRLAWHPASMLSLLVACALVIVLTVVWSVRQASLNRLEITTQAQLSRLVMGLDAELARYSYLPVLIAQETAIKAHLQTPTATSTAEINQYLARTNQLAGTMDIYLMGADGVTIAASNWDKTWSFIGKDFSFRPYFQQAMQGQLGRYYAVGTTSNERGYYFASAVENEQHNTIGVVVVKISVNAIEQQWQQQPFDFWVTDADGIIFMASNYQTLFHTLQALPPIRQQAIIATQRYPDYALNALNDFKQTPLRDALSRVTWEKQEYLMVQQSMTDAGWEVSVLTPWRSITHTAQLAAGIALALTSLSGLLLFMFWKYRTQRRRYQAAAMAELETKVAERTQALQLAQTELIQAAKMAALGQLSSTINHELNNPLGAIRAYADNARQFLERGQIEIAKTNLQEIGALTERMATITRQLKAFARKSHGQREACSLATALDSALLIMQPRFAKAQMTLQQQRPSESVTVWADLVWLEQIIINLLSNALDAVSERTDPQMGLIIEVVGEQACLAIWDNGAGLDEQDMAHLFEPFFTKKAAGHGLGLGLSISQRLALDMQGSLQAENRPEGGAVFRLCLPLAPLVKE